MWRPAARRPWAGTCSAAAPAAIAYNSCRNRHCPKCQGSRTAAWLQREASFLLPVPYYHVVFTLPRAVAAVVWPNQRRGYTLLFRAMHETLREVAADPKHLGAQVGLLAVLHTWGQDLHYHPHGPVVATGGGLACDGDGVVIAPPRWLACRPGFFLPVRVLSRMFRGKYLALLRQAPAAGALTWHGELAGLAAPAAFAAWLRAPYQREWVVYAKEPFGGPEPVLKYLARYTHRVALSNRRLLSCAGVTVRFTAKDYAAGGRPPVVTLTVEEFLRRWVPPVLPRGFVKIPRRRGTTHRTLLFRNRPRNPVSRRNRVSSPVFAIVPYRSVSPAGRIINANASKVNGVHRILHRSRGNSESQLSEATLSRRAGNLPRTC
jgi:hypothetical protein